MDILAGTTIAKHVFVLKAQILRILKQTTEFLVIVHTHVEQCFVKVNKLINSLSAINYDVIIKLNAEFFHAR